jgi:hypothetical protein
VIAGEATTVHVVVNIVSFSRRLHFSGTEPRTLGGARRGAPGRDLEGRHLFFDVR